VFALLRLGNNAAMQDHVGQPDRGVRPNGTPSVRNASGAAITGIVIVAAIAALFAIHPWTTSSTTTGTTTTLTQPPYPAPT
jgi:hypothetical protein